MALNEGTLDRILRVVVGVGLLASVFVGPKTPLGWIGVILIATGTIGFCPIYRVLGLSTAAKK
jgi:Protein of unknown function (DUF2892)